MRKLILGKGYTHFAVIGSTIYDGWDYKGIDDESIQEYTKEDLKCNYPDIKGFKIVTRKQLIAKGIEITDSNNWVKYN
ncbi:hypothetical protein OX284_005015 [Flavobacterium sp. SUN046]|uniref:hypothetical protein n=1 Tax=Flavobacterium sp. SUN046 TaxID=3002440 RepID=UPI002DB99254|nr:hypothetical protein [Flavobacterium sp. SUN046]MEC4048782.1 hypothetical protein [Flavobacterium sp. SUN046]